MANELDTVRGRLPELRDLFTTSQRLNRLFDNLFGRMAATTPSGILNDLAPRCQTQETPDHFILSCEIPGVPKENIHVEVNGNMLHISAERRMEMRGEKEGEMGQQYGRYEQILTLPESVDSNRIEAEYKDGILYLAIPKSAAHKTRRIEVGSGGTGILSKLKDTGAAGGKSPEAKTDLRRESKNENAA